VGKKAEKTLPGKRMPYQLFPRKLSLHFYERGPIRKRALKGKWSKKEEDQLPSGECSCRSKKKGREELIECRRRPEESRPWGEGLLLP